MRSKLRIGILTGFTLSLVLLLSLAIAPASARPVLAHAPAGAGESAEFVLDDIWIYDVDGNPTKISIDDAADAHGDLCPCVAAAYRATHAAIGELWDLEEEYPTQGELLLTYHNPGKGHKDVLEYILTAEASTFEMPEGTSAQSLTMDNYVYTFTRTDTGDEIEIRLNAVVVPEGYFDIRYKVQGYEKGWHDNEPTQAEKDEFAGKWSEFRDNLLTMEAWELFDGIDEEADEFPVAGMTFTGILAFLLILGGVYSLGGRVRRKNTGIAVKRRR